MAKNFLLLLVATLIVVCAKGENGNIQLKKKNISKGDTAQSEIPIPVSADINGSELNIHFQVADVDKVFITVMGAEGVVYQREVTSEALNSIRVDLSKYEDGMYTVSFQDDKGSEMEGDFTMEK